MGKFPVTFWHPQVATLAVYSLCNVKVSTGSGSMQGDPSLVIRLIDAGAMLHQKRHHVHVIIYTCLEIKHKTHTDLSMLKSFNQSVTFIMTIQTETSSELNCLEH